MAIKKPLVLGSDGRPQQLQSGDSIATGSNLVQLTADSALSAGMPVVITTADHVNKARANASGTKDVIGLCAQDISISATGGVQPDGVLALTTGQWDAVAGTSGGLSPDTIYFLDPGTAGHITATVPSSTGQYVAEVGIALSTTELEIRVQPPILL